MLLHGTVFGLGKRNGLLDLLAKVALIFPCMESLVADRSFIRKWYVWHDGVAWVSVIHFPNCMAWHGKWSSFEEEDGCLMSLLLDSRR